MLVALLLFLEDDFKGPILKTSSVVKKNTLGRVTHTEIYCKTDSFDMYYLVLIRSWFMALCERRNDKKVSLRVSLCWYYLYKPYKGSTQHVTSEEF